MTFNVRSRLLGGFFFLLFILLPVTHLDLVGLILFLIIIFMWMFKPVRLLLRGSEEIKDDNGIINIFGINWKIWLILGIVSCLLIYLNIAAIDSFDTEYRIVRLGLAVLVCGLLGFFADSQNIKLW